MLSSINQQTKNAGEDVEKGEPFCTIGRNVDWCSHCGKQYGDTSKNWKWNCLLTQQLHFWWYIQRNLKHNSEEHKPPMFIATLFTIAKIQKQPKCPSVDEWKFYPLQQHGWPLRSLKPAMLGHILLFSAIFLVFLLLLLSPLLIKTLVITVDNPR